ncbi:hypothetical protein [Streptomyces virginiae]|uniref:hypothetical protein n=1 Tax=Streptomyces virginiae TaxID=1961 RepID=UPI003AF3CBE5
MTDLQCGGAVTGTGIRSRPRAVLPAPCLAQITSWGIVYHAFPVLNPAITAITADTGWSAGATLAGGLASTVFAPLTAMET